MMSRVKSVYFVWILLCARFKLCPTAKKKKNHSSPPRSVLYISLSHKLTLNGCLFLFGTVFVVLDGCILHTINKTCAVAFKRHNSHSYQHNASPLKFLKYSVASKGRENICRVIL